MSTLTTHTTASRDSHSIGLCKFNTTSKAVEVSDGTNWLVYDYDNILIPYGNAYSVDLESGTNENVSFGNLTNLNSASSLSLSIWFKFDLLNSGGNMIFHAGSSPSDRFVLWSNQSNKIEVFMGTTALLTGTTTITTNTWYHASVFKNGTNASVYLDNNSEDSTTSAPSTTASTAGNGSLIGAATIYGPYYSDGHFDECAIWTSDISSSQSLLWNSGSPDDLSSLNPVHWWRMGDNDGGFGTTVTDQGSGSVNGSLNNGAAFVADVV